MSFLNEKGLKTVFKTIKNWVNTNKVDKTDVEAAVTEDSTNPVQSRAVATRFKTFDIAQDAKLIKHTEDSGHVHYGTAEPDNSEGENGDLYIWIITDINGDASDDTAGPTTDSGPSA